MALPATDTFTGSNGTQITAHSGSWTLNAGDFDIQSNALAPDSGGNECGAHWNADTFDDDQYAEATYVAGQALFATGIAVRCHASAATYYGFYIDPFSGTNSYLFKQVAGSWTQIGSNIGNPATSSVIRLEAEGTTLRVIDDGSTIRTSTDSSISSGYAGVAGYGDTTGARIDNWEGGNLAGAVAIVGPLVGGKLVGGILQGRLVR